MGYKTININLPVNTVLQEPNACSLASTAMVVNYLTGSNLSAADARDQNNGNTSMGWENFTTMFGLTYQRVPSGSADSNFDSLKQQLYNLLEMGDSYGPVPVVVRVSGTEGHHYVVVKGFYGYMPVNAIDENGNEHTNVSSSTPAMFKVEDPYPGWNSTNTTLADVMADKGTGDLKALYVYRRA